MSVIGTYNSTADDLKEDLDSYYKVDASKFDELEKRICALKNSLSEIVLINCAGVSYNSFAHKADVNKWNQVIEVNLIGSFNVIHEILPIMRE